MFSGRGFCTSTSSVTHPHLSVCRGKEPWRWPLLPHHPKGRIPEAEERLRARASFQRLASRASGAMRFAAPRLQVGEKVVGQHGARPLSRPSARSVRPHLTNLNRCFFVAQASAGKSWSVLDFESNKRRTPRNNGILIKDADARAREHHRVGPRARWVVQSAVCRLHAHTLTPA